MERAREILPVEKISPYGRVQVERIGDRRLSLISKTLGTSALMRQSLLVAEISRELAVISIDIY